MVEIRIIQKNVRYEERSFAYGEIAAVTEKAAADMVATGAAELTEDSEEESPKKSKKGEKNQETEKAPEGDFKPA